MSLKAVFADMDGTLFNKEHCIGTRTVAVLHALKEKGIPFIVATGRPYPDVFANLEKANLRPDFIITSNGSRVHDADHKVVCAHNMDSATICRLFQLPPTLTEEGEVDPAAPPRHLLFNVNCNDRWLTNEQFPSVRAAFHPSFIDELVDPQSVTPAMLEGTHSTWIGGEHDDLVCVQKYIERTCTGVISSTFALPHILDIFPTGMNKGVAMREVCERLGILPSECVAFGDGMNDIQMLRAAGHGYVMSNAAPMVKEAAVGLPVIASNEEEGVAVQMEKLMAAGEI